MPSPTGRPVYSAQASLYSTFFADVDPGYLELIRELVPSGAKLLDAGCGVGQYAQLLAESGYSVVAIDREPDLISARVSPTKAQFLLAGLDNLPFRRTFNLVLARGVLNDLIKESSLHLAFTQIAEALRPGGVLLADVREREAHRARINQTPVVERQEGKFIFRSERSIDADGVITSQETLFEDGLAQGLFEFKMRTFERDPTRVALELAGFDRVDFLDSVGTRSRLTDRFVIVASTTGPAFRRPHTTL